MNPSRYHSRFVSVSLSASLPPESAPGWFTHLRPWVASLTMMFCSWLSYVDRQILAVLSPMILAETAMNAQTYSTVVSAFSITYMLGNPIWGSVLDRIGLRTGMMVAVGIWSIASASHALMYGFFGFAAARAVLGFGEGATFPGGLRAAMDSLPPHRQSRGMALAYSGGSLGAILTPVIVVPIAVTFGWRAAFLLTGVLGLVWLAVWYRVARPPFLPAAPHRTSRIIWPNLGERRFWALVASYGLGASAIGPILYLAPLYLNRVLLLSQTDLGKVLWIPPLGWEIGYFFWGWVADRFAAEDPRPVRIFTLLSVLALPLGLVTRTSSPAIALVFFFWAMFVAAGFLVLSLRAGARSYPREQTALVAGIGAGAWSALVAVLLPLLGGWFDAQRYAETFALVSLLPAVGVVLWIVLTQASASRTGSAP
ncbi:MAG: MFS transporter [Bryobacterales bacterium]|nr:MFS transporter [Bryobacterales bacterium]